MSLFPAFSAAAYDPVQKTENRPVGRRDHSGFFNKHFNHAEQNQDQEEAKASAVNVQESRQSEQEGDSAHDNH